MRTLLRTVAALLPAAAAGCSGPSDAVLQPGDEGYIRFTATSFELERRDLPVEPEDFQILLRAEALLSTAVAWNRDDERVCVDDERRMRRSLFCALHQASLDVAGEYRHRRPALQEVRFAIEDATGGREFEHRLRDFNNLPSTDFDTITRVLHSARRRVAERLDQPGPVGRSRSRIDVNSPWQMPRCIRPAMHPG